MSTITPCPAHSVSAGASAITHPHEEQAAGNARIEATLGRWPGTRFGAPVRILVTLLAAWPAGIEARVQASRPVTPDLAELARRGALHTATREILALADGEYRGVRIETGLPFAVAWIDGIAFATGTIEVELRGEDLQSRSFLGLAFGGVNDSTYESVFVRPFNFRAADPLRRAHAVQYQSMPTHPWSRLRSEFPEVYEGPTDPAPDPNDWVRLRLMVEPNRVRAFVGEGAEPDMIVDRINASPEGRIGLWIGTFSRGDFANLRLIPDRALP